MPAISDVFFPIKGDLTHRSSGNGWNNHDLIVFAEWSLQSPPLPDILSAYINIYEAPQVAV